MSKHSFRDPITNVLKAWGYVESNAPGDLSRVEPDNFFLEPGMWYLPDPSGDWLPYPPV